MKKVSIVIPAHNEEKRIGKTLNCYSNYLRRKAEGGDFDYEILVVINNTTDQTEKVVRKYQENNGKIKFLNIPKIGKGNAVIEGFKDALSRKNNLIGFVDADMATPPESFDLLIKEIKNNDGAIASRHLKNSKLVPKNTFRRMIVGRVFNFYARVLFFIPFRDTQCGAKLFTRKPSEAIVRDVKMSQWAFDVELLYKLYKNNHKIIEVATIWRDIEGSKINLKTTSIQMFLALIQLRIINSPLKKSLKPLKFFINNLWDLIK